MAVESKHVVVQNCVRQADVVAALRDQDVGVVVQVDHHGLGLLRVFLQDVQSISGFVVFEVVEF